MKLKILKRKIDIINLFIILLLFIFISLYIPNSYAIYSDKEIVSDNSVTTSSLGFITTIQEIFLSEKSLVSLNNNIEKIFTLNIKNNKDLDLKLRVKSNNSNCNLVNVKVLKENGDLRYEGPIKDLDYSINRLEKGKDMNEIFIFSYNENIKCEISVDIIGWQDIFDSNEHGFSLEKTEVFKFELINQNIQIINEATENEIIENDSFKNETSEIRTWGKEQIALIK